MPRLASLRLLSTLSVAFPLVAGCGSSPPVTPPSDGGTDAWVHPDAYLAPDSCDMDHLHRLDGMMGGTVSVDFDTTMTDTRPRDLGPNCGNAAADIRWARQEVVEFHVPGTGMQGVHFSTNNTMTQTGFNTLVQVRTGDCRAVPTDVFPPTCFDDVSQTNLATDGGITVMGGTTLYFIVTGYSDPPAAEMAVDEGHVHVDFTVTPNTPPTITGGQIVFSGIDTLVSIDATDAEGPIAGYAVTLFNAMGQLDTNGDGVANASDNFILNFDSVSGTGPMYTGHATISGMVLRFAEVCRMAAVMCTQFGVRVFDQQYATSAEMRIDVHDAAIVGLGATCDATHVCGAGLMCSAGLCAATAAATSACAAAHDLGLAAPTTAATTASVGGNLSPGMGVFSGSCAQTDGHEDIYRVTVPTGDFDLALTTDTGGSMADTVLYVRSACVDATSELAMGCNDDINYAGGNYRSALNFRDIPPGDYFIFVEGFGAGGGATAYHLLATMTPVLASGTACDPAMHNYRCASGSCSATTMMCP